MPIAVWGHGQVSSVIQRVANAAYIVCDNYVPYPRQRWRRRYYQRISTVNLPLDSALFAQKIREPNRLCGIDEIVFPLLEGEIANLESAIPLIGRNDQYQVITGNTITREWSEIVFAVAGNIQHPTATRFFNAVVGRNIEAGNVGLPHPVKVAWEGYHTCSVWGLAPWQQMYNDLRSIDRAMLAKAREFNLSRDSWMLQTVADSEEYAEQNNAPHYAACSYDPDAVKIVADEDCYFEALNQGIPVLGAWMAYSTEESRIAITDAIKRAVRRRYPSGMRDSVT